MPTTQIRADVAAAQDGDNRAFARLVDQTYSDVFLLAARLTRDHDDALDVVQEVYLRAYKGLIDYRGEARFTTWLHRITINCASTLLARRRRDLHDPIQRDVIDMSDEYHPERRVGEAKLGRSKKTRRTASQPPFGVGAQRRLRFVTPENWQAVGNFGHGSQSAVIEAESAFDKPSKLTPNS